METVEHINRNADPMKVKLIKGAKDTYAWEISVQGNDRLAICTECQQIDMVLRKIWADKLGG